MNVTKKNEDGVLTVYLEGKMDTNTTPMVEAEIADDIAQAKALVIDMAALQYISSAGLRLMLSLHKKMAQKGGLTIINANETIREIFDFTGFAEILNIQ